MEITVIKKDLIKKLQENLKIHEEENKDSMRGWRQKVMAASAGLANEASYTGDVFTTESLKKKKQIVDNLFFDQPVDHSEDYKVILGMLEIHQADYVNLSEKQYKQYWLDDWDWKDQWATTNSSYK